MSLLVPTLALAAAQPVAEPAVENEITVVANRLRDWEGRWKLRKSAITCKTTRSTGDKAIDTIGCDALVQCLTPLAPQFSALEKAELSQEETTARARALHEEAKVWECVADRRSGSIAALVAARRSKRS
jgi:hypothetical protein